MRLQLNPAVEPIPHTWSAALDLVVPFTTPSLTRCALLAAEGLTSGLDAEVRLMKIHIVPFPAPLEQPTAVIDFIESQMLQFDCELPCSIDIRLSRDFEPALLAALTPDSVVILATLRRPWKTRTERLAARLRALGFHAIVIDRETVQERKKCSTSFTAC